MAKKPNEPYCLWAVRHYTSVMHWTVFPAKGKKSYKSKKFSKDGVNWGATSDPEQAEKDFRQFPNAGIGLPTGDLNPFFVVETDTKQGHNVDGDKSLSALVRQHSPLPTTLMARSPSGSTHRYYNVPPGVRIKNSSSELGPGIDVRGHGGMVIAPPTMRDDGQYVWLNSDQIADAPEWLLALVSEPEREPLEKIENVYTNYGDAQAPPPSIAKIWAALSIYPNDDLGWDDWNLVAMWLWEGTRGSEHGRALFHEWSKLSSKYNRKRTDQKWDLLTGSPPTSVTIASLFHHAYEINPNWLNEYLEANPDAETEEESEADATSEF